MYDDSAARYNFFEAELLQWLANDEALVRFGKRAPRMHAGLLHWCKAAAMRSEFAHALSTALLTVRAGATAADAALSMWLSGSGKHALPPVLVGWRRRTAQRRHVRRGGGGAVRAATVRVHSFTRTGAPRSRPAGAR